MEFVEVVKGYRGKRSKWRSSGPIGNLIIDTGILSKSQLMDRKPRRLKRLQIKTNLELRPAITANMNGQS